MGSYSTMKHLLVLAIFGFVCARSAPGPSSRVYGGGVITEFEFPFVLSFQHYRILLGRWDHVCGASLINPQWAVLSATCLKNYAIDSTRVVGGEWSFEEVSGQEQYRTSAEFHVHPNHNHPGPDYNDVALIRFDAPFDFTNGTVGAIALPAQGQEYLANTAVTVAGWGPSNLLGVTVDKCHKATMPIIEDQTCRLAYGSSVIADGMICTGRSSFNIGPCGEDLGSPLFANNQLVGLYSWDWGCNLEDYPPVYTQISYYVDWINSVINA